MSAEGFSSSHVLEVKKEDQSRAVLIYFIFLVMKNPNFAVYSDLTKSRNQDFRSGLNLFYLNADPVKTVAPFFDYQDNSNSINCGEEGLNPGHSHRLENIWRFWALLRGGGCTLPTVPTPRMSRLGGGGWRGGSSCEGVDGKRL